MMMGDGWCPGGWCWGWILMVMDADGGGWLWMEATIGGDSWQISVEAEGKIMMMVRDGWCLDGW